MTSFSDTSAKDVIIVSVKQGQIVCATLSAEISYKVAFKNGKHPTISRIQRTFGIYTSSHETKFLYDEENIQVSEGCSGKKYNSRARLFKRRLV